MFLCSLNKTMNSQDTNTAPILIGKFKDEATQTVSCNTCGLLCCVCISHTGSYDKRDQRGVLYHYSKTDDDWTPLEEYCSDCDFAECQCEALRLKCKHCNENIPDENIEYRGFGLWRTDLECRECEVVACEGCLTKYRCPEPNCRRPHYICNDCKDEMDYEDCNVCKYCE